MIRPCFRLALVALASFGVERAAHADVSSWMFVGAGPSSIESQELPRVLVPSLTLETGMGTSPTGIFAFGGLFKLETQFGHGTDLGLMFRTATPSYVYGDFGAALDVGPYQRFWGQNSTGGAATIWLGAPWGIAVGATGSFGSNDARGASLVVGFDFARLTVHRRAGTQWFPNPFPAGGAEHARL